MRALAAVVAILLSGGAARAEGPLPSGLYAMTARLELPHLERWAVDRTRLVCLGRPEAALPVPLLSAAASARGCVARDLVATHGLVGYRIACPGRDAMRAAAAYRLTPEGFRGRVAIVMGAKNMTMTEVQAGRRIGACAAVAGR